MTIKFQNVHTASLDLPAGMTKEQVRTAAIANVQAFAKAHPTVMQDVSDLLYCSNSAGYRFLVTQIENLVQPTNKPVKAQPAAVKAQPAAAIDYDALAAAMLRAAQQQQQPEPVKAARSRK